MGVIYRNQIVCEMFNFVEIKHLVSQKCCLSLGSILSEDVCNIHERLSDYFDTFLRGLKADNLGG